VLACMLIPLSIVLPTCHVVGGVAATAALAVSMPLASQKTARLNVGTRQCRRRSSSAEGAFVDSERRACQHAVLPTNGEPNLQHVDAGLAQSAEVGQQQLHPVRVR
jgi:hypothetical protein